MKSLPHPLNRLTMLALLVLFMALFADGSVCAGLTMEVDLNRANYQGSQSYGFGCTLNTNSTSPGGFSLPSRSGVSIPRS